MRFLTVVFAGLLFVSCSENATDSITKDIKAEINNDKLGIFNNTDDTIYYFVIDRNFAALANWAAESSEENAVKSNDIKTVELSEIVGYESNNEIILYYWSSENPDSDEINNIVVDH